MHFRDLVFYGLKPGAKSNDLLISIQIKGTSLDVLTEELAAKIESTKKENEESGEEDDYEKQLQIYLRPDLKENSIDLGFQHK